MRMFKPENRKETLSLIFGVVLLLVGLGLLLSGFAIAFRIVSNPSGYIQAQIPPSIQQNATAGPRASFTFLVANFTVTFTDTSQRGDAAIAGWDWDFGDGSRSNLQSPQHTYSQNFSGFVRLAVRDAADKKSSGVGSVQAFRGASSQGNSTVDPGDIAGSIDFGAVVRPLMGILVAVAAVATTFFMLLIMWLVGASIMKAGWNLIRPRPETIRIRVKPKHLEAEPVYASPPPTPEAGSMSPPPPP